MVVVGSLPSRIRPTRPHKRDGFEAALQPLCVDRSVGVIPYFSLAAGFLTGKYRSEQDFGKSARGGGMAAYLNNRGFRILAALDKVAEKVGGSPAQVAVAWLMAQPAITAPIASATSVDQVLLLAKAAELRLEPDDLKLLDEASQ